MTQQIIITTPTNSGDGTPINEAFNDCNSNFSELYSRAQTNPPATLVGSTGDQAGMYAYDSNYFYYCFADYDGSTIIWAQVSQIANVSVTTISSGTSNISITNINGNAATSINGTSNVVVVSSTGQYVTGQVSASGNITGSYILGNGSQLTGLPAIYGNANVVNLLSNFGSNTVSTTGTVTSGAITTGNIIGNIVSVTANVTGGNLTTGGAVSATGNIVTDQYFVGNFFGNVTGNFVVPGSNTQVIYNTNGNADASSAFTFNTAGPNLLTVLGTISSQGNVIGGNLTTTGQVSATGNITGGNLSGTQIAGTLSTAAQPTITSVGSLSSLIVIANIAGGNLRTAGQVSAAGNIHGDNLLITEINAGGNISAGYYTGLGISVTGNITGGNLKTAGQVSATANIQGGNLRTAGQVSATGNITGDYIFGNGVSLTGIVSSYGNSNVTTLLSAFGSNTISTTGSVTSGNVTGGNLLTGGLISATATITGGNLTTGGTVSATGTATLGNVVTGGTVSAIGAITGDNLVTAGTLTVNSGNAVTAIVNGGSNATGNIGSSSKYFNTVFATATTALYADLAECYLADADYAPGTVLVFGGAAEVTQSSQDADSAVAGIVSTKPAYQMNSGLTGDHVVAVALVGRVPCQVKGPVKQGALMVATTDGYARAETTPAAGTIIGKAVQSFNGDIGTIEVVVGRT